MTQAKIESLLYELRSWEDDAPRPVVGALAARFKLDPMMIARIAEAEGIEVGGDLDEPDADPNQTTQVMSIDGLVTD